MPALRSSEGTEDVARLNESCTGGFAGLIQEGGRMMGNPFVHMELVSTDVDKAKSFYGELFKWKLEDVDMGDMIYTLIKVGDGVGGGLMKNPVPDGHSMWLSYVKVGDVKKATSKAKSLGAKVKKDVTEVKDAGWLSIIVDPTGAMLGLWEPKKKKKAKRKKD